MEFITSRQFTHCSWEEDDKSALKDFKTAFIILRTGKEIMMGEIKGGTKVRAQGSEARMEE